MRAIFCSTIIVLFLASCDPAYRVVVRNRSGVDKHVTVFVPDYKRGFPVWSQRLNDSIEFADDHKTSVNKIMVRKIYTVDSPNATYSFILPPGHDVLLEHGFGPGPSREYKIMTDGATYEIWRGAPHVYPAHPVILGGTYLLRLDN